MGVENLVMCVTDSRWKNSGHAWVWRGKAGVSSLKPFDRLEEEKLRACLGKEGKSRSFKFEPYVT